MFRRQLPPRFMDADMALLHPVFDGVREYLANVAANVRAGQGLFLSGPPGVGKTYAIAALTKVVSAGIQYEVGIEKRHMVLRDFIFATGPSLFECYALPYDAGNKDKTDELESVNWLVINDLGKEFRSGAYEKQVPYKLGRLLRARVERRLVTHITTNLVLHQSEESQGSSIGEIYGESIYSLLMESCAFRYEVNGSDRRRSNDG